MTNSLRADALVGRLAEIVTSLLQSIDVQYVRARTQPRERVFELGLIRLTNCAYSHAEFEKTGIEIPNRADGRENLTVERRKR